MKALNEMELRTLDGGTLSYDNPDNYNALISNGKIAAPYVIGIFTFMLKEIMTKICL